MTRRLPIVTCNYNPLVATPEAITARAVAVGESSLTAVFHECLLRQWLVRLSHIKAALFFLAGHGAASALAPDGVGLAFVSVQPVMRRAGVPLCREGQYVA